MKADGVRDWKELVKGLPGKDSYGFGKMGQAKPERYGGPFKVLARVGRFPKAGTSARVEQKGIHVDDKLQFVEEPVEIMEREVKRLKRSRIPLVRFVGI
ncbi:hypothetical protein Tco_1191889 [Tanacetum coccineum]